MVSNSTTSTKALLAGRRSTPSSDAQFYDNVFFEAIEAGSLASAAAIVPLVGELVSIESVIDIGCGRGAWLRHFLAQGTRIIAGYDGNYVDRSSLLIPLDDFHVVDLTSPELIPGRYSLAVCLEVAEHLPRSRATSLVSNLCALAPAILFSAAVPGQGGTNHINEQWPFFWERLFTDNGYVKLDPIRRQVFAHPSVATHYKQNVFLYVADDLLACDQRLRHELELVQKQTVTIVADYRLVPMYSVQGAVRELLRVVRHSIRNRLGI